MPICNHLIHICNRYWERRLCRNLTEGKGWWLVGIAVGGSSYLVLLVRSDSCCFGIQWCHLQIVDMGQNQNLTKPLPNLVRCKEIDLTLRK